MTERNGVNDKDPLHGVTLKNMLEDLVECFVFPYLADKIKIKVFSVNPTFNTSLKFLRKTPWAREKVEKLYIYHFVIRKKKIEPGTMQNRGEPGGEGSYKLELS